MEKYDDSSGTKSFHVCKCVLDVCRPVLGQGLKEFSTEGGTDSKGQASCKNKHVQPSASRLVEQHHVHEHGKRQEHEEMRYLVCRNTEDEYLRLRQVVRFHETQGQDGCDIYAERQYVENLTLLHGR